MDEEHKIGSTHEAIDLCFARVDIIQSLCRAGKDTAGPANQATVDRMANIFRAIEDELKTLTDELETAAEMSFDDMDELKKRSA